MSRAARASALCTGVAGVRSICVHCRQTRTGLRHTATALAATRTDISIWACSTAAGEPETLPVAAAGFRMRAEAEAAILSQVAADSTASVAEDMRRGAAASMTAAEAGCDIQQSLDQDLGTVIEAEDAVVQGSTSFRGVAAMPASAAEAGMALLACAPLLCSRAQVRSACWRVSSPCL